jgi:hypothetical protein
MPWIFLSLMLANAAYFGWKFMESSQPQARPGAVVTAQVGDRVLLLSERPGLIPAPVATPVASPEAQPAVVAAVTGSGPQCFNVGPFATDEKLKHFVGVMKGKHFFVRMDPRKVDAMDYWVFIPAFTIRAKAEEKLRDLQGRGVSGFVVKDGAFANAISLNHFSRKELAQSFLEKMQAEGISVEYREIPRNESERWAYLAPAQVKTSLREAIDAQLEKKDNLKRENAPCEE